MTTVIGLLPNDERVAEAAHELHDVGIADPDIAVLSQTEAVWQRLHGNSKLRVLWRSAVIGALLGIGVGALYGVTAGYLNCRLGGCPTETSIVAWLLISLYWLIGGALLGAIVQLDTLQHDVLTYVDGVEHGENLIIVQTASDQAATVADILHHKSGTVIQKIDEEDA